MKRFQNSKWELTAPEDLREKKYSFDFGGMQNVPSYNSNNDSYWELLSQRTRQAEALKDDYLRQRAERQLSIGNQRMKLAALQPKLPDKQKIRVGEAQTAGAVALLARLLGAKNAGAELTEYLSSLAQNRNDDYEAAYERALEAYNQQAKVLGAGIEIS